FGNRSLVQTGVLDSRASPNAAKDGLAVFQGRLPTNHFSVGIESHAHIPVPHFQMPRSCNFWAADWRETPNLLATILSFSGDCSPSSSANPTTFPEGMSSSDAILSQVR